MSSRRDPKHLVAFPSLSGGLSTLPQATSMNNVALHANMYARAKESEAKLHAAIQRTAQNPPLTQSYMSPSPQLAKSDASSSLMMRKPQKSK
ncbi:hypothetical protein C8J56DRAFT_922935 [Mycena floridula]|nr:hypothetical protein C8J56DRAFT_922935 [Mycena floridula]